MHGSSFNGDGGQALREFGAMLENLNAKNGH